MVRTENINSTEYTSVTNTNSVTDTSSTNSYDGLDQTTSSSWYDTYDIEAYKRYEYDLYAELEYLLEREKPKEGWKIKEYPKPTNYKHQLKKYQLMPFKTVIRTRWFPRNKVNRKNETQHF